LFGHRFPIEAQGIGCKQAHRLLSRPCRVQIKRTWSCLSYHEDEPFIGWFPTEDLFKRAEYPAALLRRYPCSDAKVTPGLFGAFGHGFPTRRQLLADDVLRCHLIPLGASPSEVEQVLGPADEKEVEPKGISFIYGLGPERDSVVQIDSELLLVEFKGDLVAYVSIFQG
jgi:hypothetical protein